MFSLRILVTLTIPTGVIRLWDGAGGPYVDPVTGDVYKSSQFTEEALQNIEAAINGESFVLSLSLLSVPTSAADQIWAYDEITPLSGSEVVVSIQRFDEFNQPSESPEVVFTGEIDNLTVTDQAVESNDGDFQQSVIGVEATNAFTLRKSDQPSSSLGR
jgi:hypothetical protein